MPRRERDWRDPYLLHARLPVFERHVRDAEEIVAEALETAPRWHVAFSAGKDSTVVLDLVRRTRPETVAVWGDDEYNYPETMELINATPNLVRIAGRIRHSDVFTSWDGDDGPTRIPAGTLWTSPKEYVREHGYDGIFLGLRADESRARQLHLSTRGPIAWCKKRNCYQSNPLWHWTTRDVWAYLLTRDVPYNRAYDRLREMGVPEERQRVGPIAVDRVLGFGQLVAVKQGWPELYHEFVARHPRAAAYT
jgi:phosphoadenosine phosphosulfate reductase